MASNNSSDDKAVSRRLPAFRWLVWTCCSDALSTSIRHDARMHHYSCFALGLRTALLTCRFLRAVLRLRRLSVTLPRPAPHILRRCRSQPHLLRPCLALRPAKFCSLACGASRGNGLHQQSGKLQHKSGPRKPWSATKCLRTALGCCLLGASRHMSITLTVAAATHMPDTA